MFELRSRAHDCRRSVDVVRVVVAAVLAAHPLYRLAHPDSMRALAVSLSTRGVPAAAALAWGATGLMLLAAAALLVRRLAAPVAAVLIAVLVAGTACLYAPYWYVAGGGTVEGHPGMEYNALLVVCLSGVLWTYWPRSASASDARAAVGLDVIRVGSALLILPHPLDPFVTWDVDGMRRFGESMTKDVGLPFGVQMVWIMVSWQIACSVLLLTRRLVPRPE